MHTGSILIGLLVGYQYGPWYATSTSAGNVRHVSGRPWCRGAITVRVSLLCSVTTEQHKKRNEGIRTHHVQRLAGVVVGQNNVEREKRTGSPGDGLFGDVVISGLNKPLVESVTRAAKAERMFTAAQTVYTVKPDGVLQPRQPTRYH